MIDEQLVTQVTSISSGIALRLNPCPASVCVAEPPGGQRGGRLLSLLREGPPWFFVTRTAWRVNVRASSRQCGSK